MDTRGLCPLTWGRDVYTRGTRIHVYTIGGDTRDRHPLYSARREGRKGVQGKCWGEARRGAVFQVRIRSVLGPVRVGPTRKGNWRAKGFGSREEGAIGEPLSFPSLFLNSLRRNTSKHTPPWSCTSAPRRVSSFPVAWGRVASIEYMCVRRPSREIRHPASSTTAHAQSHESITCLFRRDMDNVLERTSLTWTLSSITVRIDPLLW